MDVTVVSAKFLPQSQPVILIRRWLRKDIWIRDGEMEIKSRLIFAQGIPLDYFYVFGQGYPARAQVGEIDPRGVYHKRTLVFPTAY